MLLQVLPGSRPAQAEEWTNFYITPRQIYDVAIEKKVCESCDYFQTYVTVWCATPVGVFEVNPNFGNYTRYSYADGLAFNSTKVITVDDDGRKWIGTTRATDTHGLMSCFDGETWATYRPPGSSIINAITVDQDGAVWLGRGDFFSTMLGYGGINVWDGDNWTVYTTDNSDLVTDYVEAITLDAAGHKWIGTSTVALGVLIEQPGGVNRFDGANWTTFHTNNSDLTGEYVYDIAIDSTGSKWVATLHNGIFRYNDSDWVNYTAADGLPSNEIQALAVDSDDTIWFGTVLNGAGSYDGAALTLYDADNSGLSNNNVHDIAVGEPDDSCANCGSVWFGTGNGLCRLNDNGWTQFPLGGIPAADYREVAVDGAGQAWFAASAGLIRYDGSSWTTFDTANSGLVSEAVSTVAVDDGNNVWAGTDAGLSVYDGSSWTVYDTGSSGLSSNAVSALAVDADDKVWVGTDAGLSVYDGSSWTVYDTGSSGLASDNVISLAVDDAGRLWAGTDAGLSRYSGGSWTVYDTDNSALVSNDIRSLAADGHGQVWGGTPEGLHRFDGSTWKIYGCGDGVDSGTITGMVVDPAADSVWFARGEAGVSRVDLSAPDQAAAAVNYGDGDSDLLIDTGCFLRTALKDH
ncbi:MAG: two-component regulator propeller domain-containing protein [Desulfosudaceae bacterium]